MPKLNSEQPENQSPLYLLQKKNQISKMARRTDTFVFSGVSLLLFIFLVAILVPILLRSTYNAEALPVERFASSELEETPVIHLETPEPVKALYMTSCVAGTPNWRANLKDLIDATELNSVVIDIKDYTGEVSFKGNAKCFVKDLKEFIGELHASNIYVIGRISVFQDPVYATLFPELAVKSLSTGSIWHDYKGLSFIDVGATPYWDYILDISREAYALGFDEINYDYVRYPSDGNMLDANYTWLVASSTRAEMLESFFSYLSDNMKNVGVVTSVDIFGMTTTVSHDLGIGQVLERALPYFDFVSPMVYPSHYPATWSGFANPAEYPYEVIKIAMIEGLRREQQLNISNGLATSTPSKLRPWLQDFNLGATYDAAKVRAEIQATYDAGLTSWMLWSAANKYTVEALLPLLPN